MLRLAVFASGGGSNLQALIDHFNGEASDVATVCLVISDRTEAGALARAERAGIPHRVIAVAGRASDELARETLTLLEEERIDFIALAGYLKLVPEAVVRAYRHRIVNIHPALLPAFGGHGMYGLRVHRAVLESGCYVTGVTVHFVDERYDEGRPLLQWPVPVIRGDTAETLAARVLRAEHAVYPVAIEALARTLPAEHSAGFTSSGSGYFTLEEGDVGLALKTALQHALRMESEGS
jgi:formyltetrahydrofolate-dependent phosphoribosylglycinamide formyltransferase